MVKASVAWRIFTPMFLSILSLFWGKREKNLVETGQLPVGYCACEMRIDSIQTTKCQCDNCAKSYIGNIWID